MSVQRLTGSWCGVCPHGLARLVDGNVIVSRLETPTVALWTRAIGNVRNLDCWSHETTGEIRVGFTNGATGFDVGWVIGQSGSSIALGRAKSILVRRKDGAWVAMLSHPEGKWTLLNIDTKQVIKSGQDAKWSALGIIDITPDWTPVWAYATPVKVGRFTLQQPHRSGPWIAAQGSHPSSFLVAYQQTAGVLLLGEARETKVAALGDGRAAVISRVEQGYGVAFALLRPSDVAALDDDDPPTDDAEDNDMTAEQYRALRDSQKRIEASLGRIESKLDTPAPEPEPEPEPEPGPQPEPEPGNDPDIQSVRFLDPPDVKDWIETSQIQAVGIVLTPSDEALAEVCIQHTMRGRWPPVTPDTVTVEGCHWVILETPDGPVGCTYEWNRPGQSCKKFYAGNLHRSVRQFAPRSGQRVGFMVSTLARDDHRSPRNERSNIHWRIWP